MPNFVGDDDIVSIINIISIMDNDMKGNGLSAYEQVKIAEMSARKCNGGTVVAISLAGLTAALAVGGWIYANARSNSARDLANARYDATTAQLNTVAGLLAAERSERVAQGVTMSQSITDSISGQQQGSQSQSQTTAIDNTVQQIMQQTFSDAVTGRSSLNPTPVNIYSAPQPCGCPGCGA